ncbi:MAG: excinuclease ABC subunit UvrB [Nitrosarchaeum sp.]|nr:excinuclease ABC subunit UvrB [Nitrosarchaeum sp.]
MSFLLETSMRPRGSQPQAIAKLAEGLRGGMRFQTLLGITGSGKTFTIANVIAQYGKPALVLSHNKTLAAQLYSELKELFPKNHVEFFVSYYDYYQPESYIPSKDQYIEKDAQVNPRIEMMRLAATASLRAHKDVIVVSSISCIYGLGKPEDFESMGFELRKGERVPRKDLLMHLVRSQYERNDLELQPGRFRVKGDTIDLVPGYMKDVVRIELDGDVLARIGVLDGVTLARREDCAYFHVYPAKHFVIPDDEKNRAVQGIREELEERLPQLGLVEAHRLKQRTLYDLEMIEETGFCKGIENYSRHLDGRRPGERPYCLLDYFPEDFLMVIDESHQSIPQARAMYAGDLQRKRNLVDYGFRLPCALDNRPLKFEEFESFMRRVVFLSATPAQYELERSGQVVEQIIRPTGLVDPVVQVRPITGQIEDVRAEIERTIRRGDRVLLTTLTKKLAEELTEFLAARDVRTRYLHSDIDTLERTEIIRQLRAGDFDVLVGINLLREGLDIPEVGFIGILDADKEGFLRDARSLIQIIGRAARNPDSLVVLYADKMTDSMRSAMDETARRRAMQLAYNKEHGITPQKILKALKEKAVDVKDTKHVAKADIPRILIDLEKEMRLAADQLNFERAIALRDQIRRYRERLEA